MQINPKLYEINLRVWIKQFGENASLKDIPAAIFNDLTDKGINIIWLLGIWKTTPSIIEKTCFSDDLVNSYSKSLKDWKKEDVIGSPFAIDSYEVDEKLGSWNDLKKLKKELNKTGLKLFLDFIPNHLSAGSEYIRTNPEYFLQADEEALSKDSFTFFRSEYDETKIFAHGRDPLFPAWTDTIQMNFFSNDAREFMINNLLKLTEVCDGVRCDMAMLPLNNVFNNTWLGVLNKNNYQKPADEFWKTAIRKVKEKSPGFIFLAEAYWDLEWDLQQLGFDFTYDKRLTDRMAANDIYGIKEHLRAEKLYQMKSVRFLENHDEQRAVIKFGKIRSLAAATLISTIQGMKLYYDGQFEGKKIKVPVQLGREPEEKVSKIVKNYYDKLLEITKDEVFIKGKWIMLEPESVGNDDYSYENLFAWEWQLNSAKRIVIINFSDNPSQCRLKISFSTPNEQVKFVDLLNGTTYKRWVEEISSIGLYISLKPYQSHIFSLHE